MYRIAWESKLTGLVNYGGFVISTYSECLRHCQNLNRQYADVIRHWPQGPVIGNQDWRLYV